MEETETSKTKVSDSAYSNSSTSQYQRSNGSSKSRHSNSSGSSGYCGRPSVVSSGNDEAFPHPPQMCEKRKDKKRKPLKKAECLSSTTSWNQENCRVGIEVIGGGTVSGVTSSVNVVIGTPTIGPNTGMNGIGVAVPSIGTEVAPIIVNNSVTETQNGGDSDALQMAALTQTLNCIKKIKGKDSTLKCIQGENGIQRATSGPLNSRVKDHIANCFNGHTYSTQAEGEGFVVVVSMADGCVVHTTRNLVAALGFPCDMWLGRDFIDFVHPKDRMAFAGHITSGVARGDNTSFKGLSNKTSFYCSLRQYRGLRNVGYGVTGKRVPYLPFRLTLTFREMNFSLADSQMAESPHSSSPPHSPSFQNKQSGVKDAGIKQLGELNGNVFLVITATRIYSAYKEPDEELFPSTARNSPHPYSPAPGHSQPVKPILSNPNEPVNPIVPRKFVTRHFSSCCLSHVDPSAVPYLGYLPQDMETRSVMDFYHPEDMPILKEAYQNVMSQQSSPFRGKPYRYKTQNGTYALIETEWSSFVNPWSRKLEFVIGQHHVLKGPSNPDVFAEPTEENCPQFSEEVLKESERIQEEIMFMLDQVCSGNKKVTRVSESARQQVSKRCRDLASFMETLMDEMAKPADLLRVELPAQDEHGFSERDSVMLGEISPHHDYYNGKSSTETPPSYNQLNYNENLQRFFESKPKTTLSDESGEMKMEGSSSNNVSQNLSTDEEGKISPIVMDSSSGSGEGRKCCSQANESESGGSGSRARAGGKGGGGGNSSHEEQVESGKVEGEEGTTAFKGNRGTGAAEPINKSRSLSVHDKARTSKHHSGDAYQSPHLTEALLSRHNEDMEKIMVQKHREQRYLDREGKLKDGRKSNHDKSQDHMISHGVKRSGSHSWEGEPQRVKHQHIELPQQHGTQGVVGPWEQHVVNAPIIVPAATATTRAGNILAPVITSAPTAALKSAKQIQPGLTTPAQTTSPPLQSFNMWSPFSVTVTPMHNSQPCLTNSCPGMAHQQQRLPTLPSSVPPPTLQPPPPPMADLPLQPPPGHQFSLPLQHPFPHTLNPHPQGLVPVYYVPTAAVGVLPPSVNAENVNTHSHLMGFPQQQVQQPQVPGYSYIVPPTHSQPTGLSSVAGTILIPNHMQYLSTIPQMVYQTVGSAQVNGPGSPHMLLPSLNNFVPVPSPYPPQLSASATADMSTPPAPIPPRQQTSAPNSHYLRMRHSSKNHHHQSHLLHHDRLQQPQTSSLKGLTKQGSLLRGRDGLGVFLMAGRETISATANISKGGMQQDEEMAENGDDNHLLFSKCQRPSSQATSVKVESGSAVGSITSVSGLCELSEVSKKCKSVGSFGLSKQRTPGDEEDYRRESREGERKCSGCTIEDGRKGRDVHAFRLLHDQETICDDSSYSSLYSFLRTEKSDESMGSFPWDLRREVLENDAKDGMKAMGSKDIEKGEVGEKHVQKPMRKGPSWLEEVDVTPDLVFRYKMDDQILHNVLEADLRTLNNIHQSSTVNEQLSQLYMDMELEGATTRLSLEDSTGFTSSSGTDEASAPFGVLNMRSSPTREKAGELHKSKKKRRTMEYGKLVMIFEENAPFPPPPTLPTYSK